MSLGLACQSSSLLFFGCLWDSHTSHFCIVSNVSGTSMAIILTLFRCLWNSHRNYLYIVGMSLGLSCQYCLHCSDVSGTRTPTINTLFRCLWHQPPLNAHRSVFTPYLLAFTRSSTLLSCLIRLRHSCISTTITITIMMKAWFATTGARYQQRADLTINNQSCCSNSYNRLTPPLPSKTTAATTAHNSRSHYHQHPWVATG